MEEIDLTAVLAVVMALGIPIVAIVCVFWALVRRNTNEKEVRRLIIENHVDTETAKLLVDEPERRKRDNAYGMLRGGCMLLGLGLGGLVNFAMGTDAKGQGDLLFWLILALGVGLGMLAAFVIEQKMEKKRLLQQSPAGTAESISQDAPAD